MSTKFEITGDNKNLLSALEGAREGVNRTARDIEKSGMSIEDMFKRIAAAAGIAFSIGQAKQFAKSVMDVRGQFQQLEIAFSTMLQSEEKANTLMKQLVDTAAKTPFDLKGVAEGAKQLLAYGTAAEDINETITRLGDIAAGLSIPLGDLVYLFGTTMTQGRMFTMDLRQFMGRGIPMAEELAKQFGVAKDEVAGLVTAGKVSAEAVKKAIWSMTDEGSKFGGLMAKQSASITGQISNIEDAIDSMLNDIGKKSEGIINGSLSVVSSLIENYEKIGKVLLQLVAVYGSYKVAVMTNIALEKAQAFNRLAHIKGVTAMQLATDVLTKKTAVLNSVLMKNPYVFLGTAVMSAVSAYAIFGKSTDDVAGATRSFDEAQKEVNKNIATERAEIDRLFNNLRNAMEGTRRYEEAKEAIISQYGKYLSGLDEETRTLKNVEGAYKAVTRAAREAAMARGMEAALKKAQENYGEKYSENYDKLYEELRNSVGVKKAKAYMTKVRKDLQEFGQISKQTQKVLMDATNNLSATEYDAQMNDGFTSGTAKFIKNLNDNEKTLKEYTDNISDRFKSEEKAVETQKKRSKAVIDQEIKSLKGELEALTPKEAAGAAGKTIKDKIKSLEQEVKVYSTSDKDIKSAAKARVKAAKDLANSNAKIIEDELRYQDELRKIHQEASDTRRDAEIAAIKNDSERERAEQDEQHQRNLRQIEEQANEMRKAIYEHNKREWENTHKDSPYENTEAGKAGWMGLQLSDDQQTIIKAQLDKENAEYKRHLADRRKAEQDAMTAYLKDFGTAEEQRLAIAQEYDKKISEARTEGERNTLVAQKQQALQSHDLEQQRKTMDMESLFNNLGQMSLDKLTQAKEELRGMLSAQNLGMDDYKTIAEQIDKVEDAIVDKQKQKKGLIGQLIPGETTVQRLKRQQAEAEEQVKAATEKVVELQQQLAGQKLGIFSLLSMGGANYTGDISAANRSAIMESARNAGFSKEKLEELEKAMDGLVVTTDNLNNANKNEEEAKKKVSEKQMLLGEAVGNLQQKVSDFAASLETINANIQALPALMDSLGLGNTGAGQAISSVASAANNAMGAMSDFSSGNYVGAAVKAIGAVKDVAGAFSPDNTAKMQKKIDELNGHSDALAMAMKSLQKAFEKSYGIDAMRNAEKQRQLLESQQRDAQMAMVYEARKHGANRSTLNASVNDNYGWQVAMAMVSQILGKNVRYSGDDFLQLSASEMQKIIDYDNGELWNKILAEYRKEGGNGGRSDQLPDMLQSYVDNFADAFDELDEVLNERLTTTTLDNVFGDYKNYLYDLANGSEDVFDNIEKNWQAMINQMVIDNLIFGKVQEQLEQWYNDLASLQRDKNEGNISPEEYARRLDALKNTYTDIMKGSQQEIEDFKEWGIIKPIEEAVEEAKTAFGSLRDTFKDSLLDMESDVDTFKKNLQRTLYEDLIEKNVFDVPFTINGMTFDDFDAYSKDWNERYAKAVADGDTAALEALIDELVQAREITAQAAETYREALKSLEETVSDTTFKDMGGSWISMLMGMDSDAETWGKEIGRTMAQKIIEQMILADTMQPLLDTLQDEFNRAMADGSSWEAVLADEGVNAALAEIEKAYPELQETVTAIMDRLGLKVEEQAKQGFSDLRSLMTSALLDTEGDMETFGKSMAETMMKQMLDTMIDSKYKERMNAISAEWAEALEAADPARIDAVKQQVMDLYKEIGDDSEIKQLTADIKALAEVTEDTSTPFDNLRSSYHSAIMDMTKTTEDFAKDINKMIADAFVDEFVMGTAFDDKLAEWKQAYANITKNGDLNEEQKVKQLKALGNLIAAEGEEMKEQTKNILGWLGLSNNVEDQGATMNMAEAATYDQFELYLGIATAQQINGEQQLSVQNQILSTLQSMSGITSPNGETVKEISSRMRTANEYLLSIRDSNKAILDTMTRKLDVINSNLTRIL